MTRRSAWLWLGGVVLAVMGSVAACGSSGNGSTANGGCVPGASVACVCAGGAMGAQVCDSDGKSFGMCQCSTTSGSGGSTTTSVTGSGGGMACQCTNPGGELYCGAAICNDAGTDSGPTDGGSCTGKVTFAAKAPNTFTAVWTDGTNKGLSVGDAVCKGMGADHVCDYDDIVFAASKGELSSLTATDKVWLQRTNAVTVTAGGPNIEVLGAAKPNGTVLHVTKGSRCDNWTYATDHLNDGEYVSFEKGGNSPTFHLDDNPCAIQSPKDIPCGGNAIPRTVLCCYPKCKAPPPDDTCTCNGGTCQ